MGHLYHGYVSHNQRVMTIQNWNKTHPTDLKWLRHPRPRFSPKTTTSAQIKAVVHIPSGKRPYQSIPKIQKESPNALKLNEAKSHGKSGFFFSVNHGTSWWQICTCSWWFIIWVHLFLAPRSLHPRNCSHKHCVITFSKSNHEFGISYVLNRSIWTEAILWIVTACYGYFSPPFRLANHLCCWKIHMWVCLKIVYPYTQWFCWSLSLWKMAIIGNIPNIFRSKPMFSWWTPSRPKPWIPPAGLPTWQPWPRGAMIDPGAMTCRVSQRT